MVEVKIERRSSGRLVNKRIILSEDDEKEEDRRKGNKENMDNVESPNASARPRPSFNSNRKCKGTSSVGFLDDEEFVSKTISSDEDVNLNLKGNENFTDYSEEEDDNRKRNKRNRSVHVEEFQERKSSRNVRLRESEKLIMESSEMNLNSSNRRRPNKMEEDDAALAAAISAGYFSDDERDNMEHVRLRNGTRFRDNSDQPSSTNTTPTYNPYARNGLGSFSGPMRRSGRTAAVVSAARVAMYSSLLNPDSSMHVEEAQVVAPVKHYNFRPNRPGGADDHNTASMYYEFNPEASNTIDSSRERERLFEEDDVDGHHQTMSGNESGEVSLAALDKIAGMDGYVRKLKEMIVFPLVYPHLFSKLNISLPRGVLFHGPPGTGKTLMARLLASACSTSTRKVSFFMRNGSDCLSKWIGEAERNMRLLFKKAKECQPSIIFFDEIDGLAPERTGRQDQSHISLVSTLLALMDGLDDRGQVIVIGATNRIHSIDAALRRPGRFDREFYFGLPDESARAQILKIHTSTWDPPIEPHLATDLANRTSGYSGADMKALCVEAALRAVQRTFPEVYESTKPLKSVEELPAESVKIGTADFEFALTHLTPSSRRHVSQHDLASLQKPQSLLYDEQSRHFKSEMIAPFLMKNLMFDASGKATWQTIEPLVIKVVYDEAVHPESFVWRFICGIGDGLDGFSVNPIDLGVICDQFGSGDIKAPLLKVLNDARVKGGAFCLLFKGFNGLSGKEKKTFKDTIIRFMSSLMPGEPVVLLFTSRLQKIEKGRNERNGIIKRFNLKSPNPLQFREYFNFVLRTLYRLISTERPLILDEESFATEMNFQDDFLLVLEIEKWRMRIGNEARTDFGSFCMKYFGRIISECEKVIIEDEDCKIEDEGVGAMDENGNNLIEKEMILEDAEAEEVLFK